MKLRPAVLLTLVLPAIPLLLTHDRSDPGEPPEVFGPVLDEWSMEADWELLPACFAERTLHQPVSPGEWTELQAAAAVERADARARLRRIRLEARDRRLLRMRGASFDPLRAQRPRRDWLEALAAEHRAGHGSTRMIVQFIARRIDESWLDDLARRGVQVLSPLPNSALVVEAEPETARRLGGLDYVRWAGPLLASDKVAPRLADRLDALEPDHGGASASEPSSSASRAGSGLAGRVEMAAYGWDGAGRAALQAVADRLDTAVEVVSLVENRSGNSRLIFRAPAEIARATAALVAADAGVMVLEPFSVPRVGNNGSIWLLQSGDPVSKDTSLFDNGLTGWGQIYGAADSGMDTDACQFRYSSSSTAQTFSNNTQPPNAYISDPNKKIISYYLLSGAELYDDSCGDYHGTHTSGCAAGDNYNRLATRDDPGIDLNDGMAPAAQIVFQDAGRHDGSLVGLYYSGTEDLHEQAHASGARVHNNSFGLWQTSVDYDTESRSVDLVSFRERDYLIVYSAGNSGDQGARSLGGTGSTAKNTLCVGANMPGWSGGDEDMAEFSSRGPCKDGRIKPDLMAPGVVISARESRGTSAGKNCANGMGAANKSQTSPPNDQCSTGGSYGEGQPVAGTSFSSPTAAGMAILARQYFTDGYYPRGVRSDADGFNPSNALLKAVLINSARNLEGSIMRIGGMGFQAIGSIDPAPSNQQGHGVITLDDALYFDGDRRKTLVLADIANGTDDLEGGFEQVHDNRYPPIETGETHVYSLQDVKSMERLTITLNWSDPPNGAYAAVALVNDLDLEVVSPSGAVYRGNVGMNNGISRPVTGSTRDSENNTERVNIEIDQAGTWEVKVIGRSVEGIACFVCRHDVDKQGYALVAAGYFSDEVPDPGPRVTYGGARLSGGCDQDEHLERAETAELEVTMLNRGDRLSDPVEVTLDVAPGSQVGADRVTIGPVDTISYGTLSAGASLGKAWFVTLSPGSDLCGQSVTFRIRWSSGSDSGTHEYEVQTDWDDSNGGECETSPCLPRPVVSGFSPDRVKPGDSLYSATVTGDNFEDGARVEFIGGGVSVGNQTMLEGSSELTVFNFEVAANAVSGPRDVRVINPDEQFGTGSKLLWVEGSDADIDVDLDLDLDSDSDSDVAGSGCECAAAEGRPGQGAVGWIVLALVLGLRRRRERRW